jgi:hypothetical protein
VFLEFNKCSNYFKIGDNWDVFAFKRITNEGGDTSACPVGNRSVFKKGRVIFDVSNMCVLEVGFLEAKN